MKICRRCLVDESVAGAVFDESGNCNYCAEFLSRQTSHGSDIERIEAVQSNHLDLGNLVKKVHNPKAEFDCVVGVSGGVDSSWTLVKVLELGLRPLVVHFDNTWNSELANNNIYNLVERLGLDLNTHVADPDDYSNAVKAFLNADVIDIELVYDNAYQAVCYKYAAKNNIKYILSGMNQATEGMRFPVGWSHHNKWDKRNILNILKASNVSARSIPLMSAFDWLKYRLGYGIKWIPFLDYLDYNKSAALESLERDFGYKRYPYKHYENVLTRFYQGHILPVKFRVDKRVFQLSNLTVTGQMSRQGALEELRGSPYPDHTLLELDTKFFTKKLSINPEDLSNYLARPGRKHSDFGEDKLIKLIRNPILSSLRNWLIRILT